MENPDTKDQPVAENDAFERGLADAMRNGMAEGQNGDTVNQIPAAAQTNPTALDHDPQRKNETREGADDPAQQPAVERDLKDVTPAPPPADAPAPNPGYTPDSLQQPTEADVAQSQQIKADGEKNSAAAGDGNEPSNAQPEADDAKPSDAQTATKGFDTLGATTGWQPTGVAAQHEQKLQALGDAGLGTNPVKDTPNVSDKLQATDQAADATAGKTDKEPAVAAGSEPDIWPPSFTAAKDEAVQAEQPKQPFSEALAQSSMPQDLKDRFSDDALQPGTSTYQSTDDRRVTDASPAESATGSVAGGAFRAKYRALSDSEKDLVDRVKTKAEEFYRLIAEAGGTDPASDRPGSANLTLAFRALEDAVVRTVKHITA